MTPITKMGGWEVVAHYIGIGIVSMLLFRAMEALGDHLFVNLVVSMVIGYLIYLVVYTIIVLAYVLFKAAILKINYLRKKR